VVQGLRILKGLGAVTTVSKRYAAVSDAAFERTIAANAAQARLNAITEILGSVYVIAVGIGAGFMALHSIISVGELITVIGLTQFIITPMTMLGRNIASRWAAAKASAERIRAVLAAPGVDAEEPQLPALAGGVNVLGESAPADLEFLPRERFLVAPHETILFEGSVGDNIHPDDRVAQNALYVAAGEDIPGGLDREVGEAGRNLSGGQQQRVALARAIAANPEVLVLADPTTAVDTVTEHTIAQRVAEYRGSKTTLVYTTSPAWRAVGVRI
jgi:ABC superfamily ATP binding cassette transporter, ABC protein